MTDTNEINTDETLLDGQELSSAGGEAADGSEGQETSNQEATPSEQNDEVVEALSQALGKEFPDRETALKSIKDTYSYVGKKKEDAVNAALNKIDNPELEKQVKELKSIVEDTAFYSQHPEYEPYKGLIKKFGDKPDEVVKTDDFKEWYEKAKSFDETKASQSVLASNPRLAGAGDKLSKANEAVQSGDTKAAGKLAVDAVLDAYGLDKKST